MKKLYYVLMTKCGKCSKLNPLGSGAVKMQSNTKYVLAVSEKDVYHPVTGKKTIGANQPFLLNEGEAVAKYGCPRNPELTFAENPDFASECPEYEPSKRTGKSSYCAYL